MIRWFAAAVLVLMCAACAHNLPDDDIPNRRLGPNQARAFVDVNGTFFPPGWTDETLIGRGAVEARHSLFAATAGRSDGRALILSEEERWLADLTAMADGKRRVFIFLVGFNTNQAKSTPDLEAMRNAIEMGPDDLSIQFFWDGHNARAGIDAARIWFWGTGASKVAGQRGLRQVINAAGDREVIIVSYSRGASVVLSALSDPSYSDRFREQTLRLTYLEPPGEAFFTPPPLAPGGPIRVIMLAPAVGEADFWGPDRVNGLYVFRDFPERLASIRYSVNRRDYVLNKLWIGLADNFNSTTLGAGREGGAVLDCHYGFLQGYDVEGRVGHGVPDYLADPSFRTMLRDSGLQPRGEGPVGAPAPIVRRPGCGPRVQAAAGDTAPWTGFGAG